MSDNIDKDGIRRAIDRLQEEHPAHFTFDVTLFDNGTDFTGIQRAIDMVAKKCQDDADINIICEMAKLYLEGVKPTVTRPRGTWTEEFDESANPFFQRRWRCSACNDYNYYGRADFCPCCGADMREGDAK